MLKGMNADETAKMAYFEEYKKAEKRINRKRIIKNSVILSLAVFYSVINYEYGYLPAKNLYDEGKNQSQIEQIIDKSQNIILNKAVIPGRYLCYLLNSWKLEIDNKYFK